VKEGNPDKSDVCVMLKKKKFREIDRKSYVGISTVLFEVPDD